MNRPPMFVRLKPYDKQRGQVALDRTMPWSSGRGPTTKYRCGDWHEIDMNAPGADTALAILRAETQDVANPSSGPAFDVCTLSEAKSLIEQERMQHVEQVNRDYGERPIYPDSIVSALSRDLNAPDPVHELETRPTMSAQPDTDDDEDAAAIRRRPAPKPRARKPAKKKPARKTAAKKTTRKQPSKG